jgi:hypothetical protein
MVVHLDRTADDDRDDTSPTANAAVVVLHSETAVERRSSTARVIVVHNQFRRQRWMISR